ncbi:MAG: DUF4260 domain-containing protein [Bacteroidetes bacterium]|nr:DUF4260 domain-containing protein [Bacteroidota bacterium]
MKTTIQLEELGMLILSIFLFSQLHFAWWWFLVWILAPDISMLGYALNNKIGAISYNLFHHKAVAIMVYIFGCFWHNENIQFSGLILFGHASMDRIMGYGLKYFTGFKHTHLGDL